MDMRFGRALAAATALVAATAASPVSAAALPTASHRVAALAATPITPNGSWTVYHHDPAHTGYDSSAPQAISGAAGWVSPTLDQAVYGEPLVYNGIVYVSTSNNTVYALNQTDGSVVWSTHFGAPETGGWQCGNVNPTGILGTGVVDVAQSRFYVVAFLHQFSSYYLYGLDLSTGQILLTTQILPTGFNWTIQQQRGALALSSDGSHIYIPFGGRAGDCGPYHGWVEGAPTAGGLSDEHYETPSTGSGIWSAGGVVVDASTGNVFFSTGNAIPCSGAINSDSIVRTGAALGLAASFFQPTGWSPHWCGPDLDLGSAAPVLISPSLMFTSGKYGQGFLLDPTSLGGTGGQLFPGNNPYVGVDVCHGINSDATFGSFAYAAPRVYLECDGGGLVSLQVDTAGKTFTPCASPCSAPSWIAGAGITFGPPIVAGGAVWVADVNGSGLYAYDAATGAQVYHSAGFGVTHFTTPSEAGGQVFVSSDTVVRSFTMTAGCSSVTASANPPSHAQAGATVTITSVASGCPNPTPQYEIWMRNSNAACCQQLQPYGPSASYPWNTTGLIAGTYYFSVWAKDANSPGAFANSLGRYDASYNFAYTLTGIVCTGVTASEVPTAPQLSGTPVAITGSATGCTSPLYKFFVLYPNSQTWLLARDYASSPTYNWTSSGLAPGVYTYQVWARDSSSPGMTQTSLGGWDAYTSFQYQLTSQPCVSITPSSNPSGTTAAGNPVTISGAAAGCPNPQYELFVLYPGSNTWLVAQYYSPSPTYNWSTAGKPKGTYQYSIWARDASSPGTTSTPLGRWDTYAMYSYTLT